MAVANLPLKSESEVPYHLLLRLLVAIFGRQEVCLECGRIGAVTYTVSKAPFFCSNRCHDIKKQKVAQTKAQANARKKVIAQAQAQLQAQAGCLFLARLFLLLGEEA